MGIVLVVGSVAGVAVIVSQADATTEVLIAADTIAAGDPIVASDLTIAHVRLGTAVDFYLQPGALPPDGVIAVRSITQGNSCR